MGACCILLATTATLPTLSATAEAIAPPVIIAAALPSDNPVAPLSPTRQGSVCADLVSTIASHTSPPQSMRTLRIPAAWMFSRGEGQRVAVIDTGVARNSRLTVIPGGDYVSDSDGTSDCDGHGTQVAGIIAGHPDSGDGFAGVAPAASIIAIRQSSPSFSADDYGTDIAPGTTKPGYGNVVTLARAIVHSVKLGATVINISEAACAPASRGIDDANVGAAVKYAYDHNVVVVAAAGNVDSHGDCSAQNPSSNVTNPSDPWGAVTTVTSPGWFSDYVLTVGATDPDGQPVPWSLRGPWVAVAAPGTGVVSLNANPRGPNLIDAERTAGKIEPLIGTSYAAPYVSGLAAAIRSRFPRLTARQVMDRITATAHHTGDGRDGDVGFGTIDPVAALSNRVRPMAALQNTHASKMIAKPTHIRQSDNTGRYIAAAVAGASAIICVVVWLTVVPRRRIRPLREDIDY